MSVLGSFLAESLVYLRTYAIMGGSRWTMVLLSFINICCLTISVFFAARGLLEAKFDASPLPSVMHCSLPLGPKWIEPDLLAMMFSELVIAIITIRKALSQRNLGLSKFAVSLYREGLIIFAFLFGFLLANVALNNFRSLSSKSMLLMLPQRVLHSILLSRMLLHLRQSSPKASASNSSLSSVHRAPSVNATSGSYDQTATISQPSIEFSAARLRRNTINILGQHRGRESASDYSMHRSTRSLNMVQN